MEEKEAGGGTYKSGLIPLATPLKDNAIVSTRSPRLRTHAHTHTH
jgi:hypothetical protein